MNIRKEKELNFEINLLPFISVLSICISILLTISVFILIGKLDLHQATGTAPIYEKEKPVLVVYLDSERVWFQIKNTNRTNQIERNEFSIVQPDWEKILDDTIKRIKNGRNDIDTSIVLSNANVPYQNIINIFQSLKNHGITQFGLSSL